MEAPLLPSEIARLVLGYLEEQKCTEAAKLFLETSPHLRECREVLLSGRRFSTRVNGSSLIDVVEKFSAINTMIQERLNKVTDCGQLKHCGDLIEQLKFLVEEPRGQRFVVNINVPSQSNAQTSNGSPIAANNIRKRHHSNSERIKRINKSQSNVIQQSDIVMSPPTSCHNIEATPLESLPGNVDQLKQTECAHIVEKRIDNIAQKTYRQYEPDRNNSTATRNRNNSDQSLEDILSVQSCEMDIGDKRKGESNAITAPTRYTTSTSTEELLSYSSTEVQTIPDEIPESECESNDEPIENLSILTKEILNRTELQECIAENINKAIIPTDLSFKDDNLNDSILGDGNTSIMAELNSAIKSIVEATESDPVFEKFLDEFIGPHIETDTSPEEDGEGKLSPKSLNDGHEKQTEIALDNISSPEPTIEPIIDKGHVDNGTADVPLKHRLRSSSRQQYNRIEDEVDKTRDQEKEQNALEDQNAAAVLSIINVNITSNHSDNDKKALDSATELIVMNDHKQKAQTIIPIMNKNNSDVKSSAVVHKSNNVTLSANNSIQPKVRKSTVKRPRPTKSKRDQMINDNQNLEKPLTEQEIMSMPTLIVCSKDEVNNLLVNRSSNSTSRFIPIAPKDSNRTKDSMETLYLRTVNVAQQVPIDRTLPTVIEESDNSVNQIELLQSKKKNNKVNKRLKTVQKADATISINVDQQVLDCPVEATRTGKDAKYIGGESITLYANETSAKTLLDSTSMPTFNLDENINLSGSGLSPYIKFDCSKTGHNLSDIDLIPMTESAKNTTANNDGIDEQQSLKEVDIITKRTPKSLLKSRSKNHRLSLSTPRKRSNHIRALDFSTPIKTNSTRKTNQDGNVQLPSAKHLKSVCRTSLFRSPSLSYSSAQKQQKSPKVCQPYRIPIATRSPAPKLMGGWDKCNGVGIIIGEVSPHGSTSASSSSDDKIVPHKPSKIIAGNWDADLRKSIQLDKKDDTESNKKPVKRKYSVTDKDDMPRKKTKYNPRSTKGKSRRKTCIKAEIDGKSNDTDDINEPEENSQENVKIAIMEKNYVTAAMSRNNEENLTKVKLDSVTDKSKISELANAYKTIQVNSTNSSNSNTIIEKKPVKKYAQLKTISTNLRKSDNGKEKSTEDSQASSKVYEISRILTGENVQHISRMPDMINLETPRKFDNTGPPPTPRLLSPSSNAVTPFIKISEDSAKIGSFISTPDYPITPGISITPKGETTGDVIKRGEYNSQYYKPISDKAQNSDLKVLELKSNVQESPILSSSHITLPSTHNSLTSGNTYQTYDSSKLEITQFEVIKENLPREEAIKELKIASSSKDSTSAGLNTSIVTDHHIDLIQINEFKGTSEHHERIIDTQYVIDAINCTDCDRNNSSSSSDTSSSSSSSSSSSTSTSSNTSCLCSPIETCYKDSSKTRIDIDNDFVKRSVNAPENTNVVKNDASINVPIHIDTYKKTDDNASIAIESSPKKVFPIVKTDEQIEATLKETPAKDEALLNEADISETPSGSKNGMEFLSANLSTKISAIMTENEKLLKSNDSPNSSNGDKIKVNKSGLKSKITNIKVMQPGSLNIIKPRDKCRIEQEHNVPMYDKLLQRQQLEEKRQRMITKIKDNTKLNLCSGTKRKRILSGKVSDNIKKNTRFGAGKRNIQSTAKYSRKTVNKDVNKNIDTSDNGGKSSIVVSTRKRRESQKQNLVNKYCDNEEEMENRVIVSKNTDSNLILTDCENNSSKSVIDHTTRQSHKNNIYNAGNNIVENYNKESESAQSHKDPLIKNQQYLKEKFETKEDNCSIKNNITKGEIGEVFKDKQERITEKEIISAEKDISVQETSVSYKQEINDQTEDNANKSKQIANHVDKSECCKILKYKMDQVKRDLFSDEENDHKVSSILLSKDNKTKKFSIAEIQNANFVNVPNKNENSIENPKQEFVQCLQLVPAHKNEQSRNDENQSDKQHKEQNEHENEADDKLQQAANVRNCKAEYHFVYDDSAPIRKRRRRYSAHELQIEINHADLSDPNPVECMKVMKATELEEIFYLPPKSKKRTANKKSVAKTSCKTYNYKTDKDACILQDNTVKPLATSSPVDEPTKTKTRKVIIKTAATNKTDNDTQSDAKRKQKLDKPQVKDITAKSRKRKLSETKETKQIEKKPCMTDPQTLLSNFGEAELNNFLTAVHGPDMLSLYKCV